MPVHPDTPKDLAEALESMEYAVQDFKKRIGYVAPEAQDELWIELQMRLAESYVELFNYK